jgi:pimeloyl-ACP methyl ester carboxylesterase
MGKLKLTLGYIRYSLWKKSKGKKVLGDHADVNDIKMYYETCGSGEPLLFLHGGTAFIESYMFQIPFFSKNYRIIAVDSRAHGRSTDSEKPLSYSLMASDVLYLLDFLNIKKTNIIGWSDGGIIGIELAIKHPEIINKLILIGASTHYEGMHESFIKKIKDASADNWIDPMAVDIYRKMAPDPAHVSVLIEKIKQLWLTEPVYTQKQIASIKSPTLVITGKDEELIKEEHTISIAQTIPGAKLELIPNTGHYCPMEDPKSVNRLIGEFLAQQSTTE